MSNRRKFLSNIVLGAAAASFIGKVTEANEHEVEEFGQPNLVLGERKKVVSNTKLILRAYCNLCDENIVQLIREIKNGERTYHVYRGQTLIDGRSSGLEPDDIVLKNHS